MVNLWILVGVTINLTVIAVMLIQLEMCKLIESNNNSQILVSIWHGTLLVSVCLTRKVLRKCEPTSFNLIRNHRIIILKLIDSIARKLFIPFQQCISIKSFWMWQQIGLGCTLLHTWLLFLPNKRIPDLITSCNQSLLWLPHVHLDVKHKNPLLFGI